MLEVRNLTKDFTNVRAVDSLSFHLDAGSVCGFIGPNGAGKTTTMRIVTTLEEPTSGDVLVEGKSIFEDPYRVRKTVGFMPDHYGTYPSMHVCDYLEFYARSYDLHGRERKDRIDHIMGFTGLDNIDQKNVEDLSKGMRQRLNLGRALINDPQLMILDEPAAGLDPRARVELRYLIRELADAGKTIFVSSHILTELSEMCDSMLIIDHGKRITFGNFEDIQKELQDTLEIIIRLAGSERISELERFLSEKRDIHDVRIVDNEKITLTFGSAETEIPSLIREIIKAGFDVLEFRPQQLTMEEVFMQITVGNGHEDLENIAS